MVCMPQQRTRRSTPVDPRRRRPRPRPPHRRRHTPEVSGLERRELMTVVPKQATVLVVPQYLPPNGQNIPVTFTGTLASTRSATPVGFFHVTDEYRRYEPFGNVALTPLGASDGYYRFGFKFTVSFPAQRSTNTPDGRHYYVLLGAQDQDNTDGRTVAVLVPKTYPPPQLAQAVQYGQSVVTGPRAAAAARRR